MQQAGNTGLMTAIQRECMQHNVRMAGKRGCSIRTKAASKVVVLNKGAQPAENAALLQRPSSPKPLKPMKLASHNLQTGDLSVNTSRESEQQHGLEREGGLASFEGPRLGVSLSLRLGISRVSSSMSSSSAVGGTSLHDQNPPC